MTSLGQLVLCINRNEDPFFNSRVSVFLYLRYRDTILHIRKKTKKQLLVFIDEKAS